MNRMTRNNNIVTRRTGSSRVQRELRNACRFEQLEERTLMSATVAAPSALTAMATAPTAVQLAWQDNTTAVTSYGIWRSADGGQFTEVATLGSKTADTYTDTSVASGQTYQYAIQAVDNSAASAASNFATTVTPLKAATGLTATAAGSSVTLNWTPNDTSALGFYIYRSTNDANFTQIATVGGASAHSYTDNTVTSGTPYYYTIVAVNSVSGSAASNVATAVTPLAAPTGLTASVSGPSIVLSWTPNDSNELGFYLYRSTNGATFTQIATVGGSSANTYTDTTVAAGTSYSYALVAVNTIAASAASNIAGATTPLAAPTGLNAAVSGSSIDLSWTANDPTALGFYVYRSTNDVNFTQIATASGAGADSYVDNGAAPGTTYYYDVIAVNMVAASPVSNTASTTTPLSVPTGLTANASGSSIDLNWTATTGATGYLVYRSTNNVQFNQVASVGSVTSYADTSVASGTKYYYLIEATNSNVTSQASSIATATTTLATPTSTGASVSGTSINVTWSDLDPSATGYYIFRSTNDSTFTNIATVSSGSSSNYLDATTTSGKLYYYEVEAFDASTTSAASTVASATTPLTAPTALTANVSGTSIELTWTDEDASANGYYVYRSTNDSTFTNIATVSGGASDSYLDSAVTAGTTYYYDVVAVNTVAASPVSNTANTTTPLSVPTGLTAHVSGSSIDLNWSATNGATGYLIYRSTNDVQFGQIATVGNVTSYADSTVASGTKYYYLIEATDPNTTSQASSAATATTTLATPTTVNASVSGTSINVTWSDSDPSATGYYILRSTNDSSFTNIATVTGGSSTSYLDSTVSEGTTYYYQVEAFDAVTTSAASVVASQVVPLAQENTVTITSRYTDDELVVNATGTDDTIDVSESGGTFTIDADGTNFTDAATAGGLFVYTRGGTDTIDIASSVTSFVTLETIDGALTTIDSAGADVTAWIDSTDSFTNTGSATVHKVASFAGGVSKAYGAALANPSDAGSEMTVTNASLFGTGPVEADANQGGSGDCYFVCSLAAFAQQDPNILVQSAVDMGDGTYVVQFLSGTTPTFVRVSNQFSAGPFDGFEFAHPGANGTIWASVMEKAFAYYRTDANTYASIASGWMGEVYSDFGLSSSAFVPDEYTQSVLYSTMATDLADGDSITLGTSTSAPNLVSDHGYTLMSVYETNGIMYFEVRNPWGFSGDSLENSQGIATVTYAQFCSNFVEGCVS